MTEKRDNRSVQRSKDQLKFDCDEDDDDEATMGHDKRAENGSQKSDGTQNYLKKVISEPKEYLSGSKCISQSIFSKYVKWSKNYVLSRFQDKQVDILDVFESKIDKNDEKLDVIDNLQGKSSQKVGVIEEKT